jgi:hypothetical protein
VSCKRLHVLVAMVGGAADGYVVMRARNSSMV